MLGAAVQIVPHVPQFEVEFVRLVSQPSTALPLQSPAPERQMKPQAPAAHVRTAPAGTTHEVAQVPQWAASVANVTSHPSATFRLQSACPGVQTKLHVPAAHTAVELGAVTHAFAQDPQ